MICRIGQSPMMKLTTKNHISTRKTVRLCNPATKSKPNGSSRRKQTRMTTLIFRNLTYRIKEIVKLKFQHRPNKIKVPRQNLFNRINRKSPKINWTIRWTTKSKGLLSRLHKSTCNWSRNHLLNSIQECRLSCWMMCHRKPQGVQPEITEWG